jgi:hypothetical protein
MDENSLSIHPAWEAGNSPISTHCKEEKMNYRWNQNHLHHKEDFEALRRGDFTEHEIEQLTQLRRDRTELELSRTSAEYQRLAFVRWLVATGKLSDHFA